MSWVVRQLQRIAERTDVCTIEYAKTAIPLATSGRPFGCKRFIEGLTRNRMLPSVRPVMRPSRWPVWEFADRNHITNSVLMARWKALVLPAPSR